MKKTRSKTSSQRHEASVSNSANPATPAIRRSTPTPGASASADTGETHAARWTFLSNHSHVLILLSRNPSIVLRHVATQVGITERAVQRIIADLEEAGIIEREKVGRQNHYSIDVNCPLRHAVESHRTIGDLLTLMALDAE